MYWYLTKDENEQLCIRRFHKGKQERYPKKEYKDLLGDDQKLASFLNRINLPLKQQAEQENILFNNSFFEKKDVENFCKFISRNSRVDNKSDYIFKTLSKYFFEYFLPRNCRTREDFYKEKENWFDWLIKEHDLSYSTIKHVIQFSNRFLKSNGEKLKIDYYQFSSNDVPRKVIQAKRINEESKRIFVADKTFKKLLNVADKRIISHLKLAYYYGLRLGETLAITCDNIYESHIEITSAIDQQGKLTIPKDAERRKIPHLYTSAEDCYEIISSKIELDRTTVSKLAAKAILTLQTENVISKLFDFHALRGSFCTNTMNRINDFDISYNQVREYMGHSQLSTTMLYLYKSDSFSDKKYIPKKKVA